MTKTIKTSRNETTTFKTLLQDIDPKNAVFLVGNGINLYRHYLEDACDFCPQRTQDKKGHATKKTLSWCDFLQNYCRKQKIGIDVPSVSDLTFPEIVCLLDLQKSRSACGTAALDAKTDIDPTVRLRLANDLLKINKQDAVHGQFLNYSATKDIPILTTNIDRLLSMDLNEKRLALTGGHYFSATKNYKWNYCYTEQTLPADNQAKLELAQHFAVWHIHGRADYPDTVKIGLDDYINCTSQAKKLLSSPGKGRISLFDAKTDDWVGRNTWLDLFFRREIIVIGLALDSQEVFLRWLFIQRAKYLQLKYPDPEKRPKAWFIHTDADLNDKSPKGIFFQACGMVLIREKRFCDIYKNFY